MYQRTCNVTNIFEKSNNISNETLFSDLKRNEANEEKNAKKLTLLFTYRAIKKA